MTFGVREANEMGLGIVRILTGLGPLTATVFKCLSASTPRLRDTQAVEVMRVLWGGLVGGEL